MPDAVPAVGDHCLHKRVAAVAAEAMTIPTPRVFADRVPQHVADAGQPLDGPPAHVDLDGPPVLGGFVLHGAADPLLRPAAARRTAAAIACAGLVILPGVGHDLPAAVWPLVGGEVRALAYRAYASQSHLAPGPSARSATSGRSPAACPRARRATGILGELERRR